MKNIKIKANKERMNRGKKVACCRGGRAVEWLE
jgi:hypothetical protein